MEAQAIVNRLVNNGFPTFFVGGSVRDSFLGIQSKDIDISTKALPEQIESLFSDCKVNLVGKTFGVTLVNGIEVATFRQDNSKGLNHHNVSVTFVSTIEEDLSRRDLTINAIARDHNGSLIDPFNGVNDIHNRVIKFVGNPFERIFEDPNRIIRACRFLAKLNGKFDPQTFQALKDSVSDFFPLIAKERIRLEIMKAMEIKNASRFFIALHDIGALKLILPSLDACVNLNGGDHHRESVFDHSMIVGDFISPNCPITKLTGFLHDVGKFSTFKEGTFLEHETVGSAILKQELSDLTFSNREIEIVCALTELHMRTVFQTSPKAIRRLVKALSEKRIHFFSFLRLKHADFLGNLKNLERPKVKFSDLKNLILNIESAMDKTITKPSQLAINGHVIMNITGLPQGKQIGQIIRQLEEIVLDEPELNNIESLSNIVKNLLTS